MITEAHEHLVHTLIQKLTMRDTAMKRYNQTYDLAQMQEKHNDNVEQELSSEKNAVNIRKYNILNDLYDIDKNTAFRRVIRFAIICILFTTIVLYLGIHRYVSAGMATFLCFAWWTTFVFVLIYTGKTYQFRDKLFWNRFIWQDQDKTLTAAK
jgi:hypothetical protein